MTEIEKVKQEIKVLEAKLSLLEELKNTKTPVEKAFKDWWGEYPGTEIWCDFDETRWVGFKAGYEASQKDSRFEELIDEILDEPKIPKLPTLYEIVADWWDEIFLHNNEAGETIESLIDTIAEDWFFEEDKDEDRYACGWNDCLEKLKLRLK